MQIGCSITSPTLRPGGGGGGSKQGIFFLDDRQPARMFYELNYSKIFIYYCLTQGVVSG